MKAKIATLIIPAFMLISLVSVVSAQEFHAMEGSSVSVTSEVGAWPQETVLDDAIFDAQSGPVAIGGTIFDLYLASGGWPDTAYLEIGVRPEATKEVTNAGVYMIVLASQTEGILAIHLQDYGGQRPPCPPWPAYIDAEKAKERIDYRIILVPYKDGLGGTAYLELWDVDGTRYEAPSLEYGYSTKGADIPDEDLSTAHLFYSIMADATGKPDITYSATVGDIKTNIMKTELLQEQIRQKDEEIASLKAQIAEKQNQIDELNQLRSTDVSTISRLQKERNELEKDLDYWESLPRGGGPVVMHALSQEQNQQVVFAGAIGILGVALMLCVKSFVGKPSKPKKPK